MPNHAGKLSARQERFVAYYSQSPNAAEAARLAGYSAKTARVIGAQNLTKVSIKQALEARQRVFAAELRVAKEDVIAGLLAAIQMARLAADPQAMIKGWTEIGKMLGYYAPETTKLEITDNQKRLQSKFEAMSDEDLLAIVAAGM